MITYFVALILIGPSSHAETTNNQNIETAYAEPARDLKKDGCNFTASKEDFSTIFTVSKMNALHENGSRKQRLAQAQSFAKSSPEFRKRPLTVSFGRGENIHKIYIKSAQKVCRFKEPYTEPSGGTLIGPEINCSKSKKLKAKKIKENCKLKTNKMERAKKLIAKDKRFKNKVQALSFGRGKNINRLYFLSAGLICEADFHSELPEQVEENFGLDCFKKIKY